MEEQTSEAIEMEEEKIETEEKETRGGEESVEALSESSSSFRFDASPLRLYHFAHQFRTSGRNNNNNNFLKGVQWSPDGSCFLTCSDDNSLRLFYLFVTFPFLSCSFPDTDRTLKFVIFAKGRSKVLGL